MGQVGQAFSNPNTFAAQPSGFNGSEWAARFLGNGAKGALGGLGGQPQPQFMRQQNFAPQGAGTGAPASAPGPVGNNGSMWPGDSQTRAKWGQNPYFYGYGQGQ